MESYNARGIEFTSLKRARLLQQVSEDFPSKIKLFRKCFRAEASPRVAIKAKCLECTWGCHNAIRGCTADSCPIWEYRPFTDSKGRKPAVK